MNPDVQKWLDRDGQLFLKELGVKQGDYVLDFGCGEGHYTIPAAKAVGERGKVYALDKDKDSLHKLRRIMNENGVHKIEVLNADSEIPLNNSSVDVVLCYDVIHYSKDRRIIYDEVWRVLKAGGVLSVYPKHCKEDHPLRELAHVSLNDIVREIETVGFYLRARLLKKLLHDDFYNDGYILNFEKRELEMDVEEWRRQIEEERKGKDKFFKWSPQSPIPFEQLETFKGLNYYAPEPKYRFYVTLFEHSERETLEIEDTKGNLREFIRWGEFAFNVDGVACKLQAYKSDMKEERLFLPFKDLSSGMETYAAGRYLDLDSRKDIASQGQWVLDFNKAYNPWCAYSKHYACPFTPAENWLKVYIRAGEKSYK